MDQIDAHFQRYIKPRRCPDTSSLFFPIPKKFNQSEIKKEYSNLSPIQLHYFTNNPTTTNHQNVRPRPQRFHYQFVSPFALRAFTSPYLTNIPTEAKEEITPDSTKSTQEKVKETFTDTTDRLSRGTQPDESKSTGQEAFDRTQRASDRSKDGGTPETM